MAADTGAALLQDLISPVRDRQFSVMHAALPPSVIVEKPTGEGVQALSSDSVTEFQAFTRRQISFGADMARIISAALK